MQGRDANRVLQRTIKAEERKKRLPKLIARLRQLLEEWGAAHGGGAPFMLGAMPYATHVLDVIEDDFHAMADMKPPRVRLATAPVLGWCARDAWSARKVVHLVPMCVTSGYKSAGSVSWAFLHCI